MRLALILVVLLVVGTIVGARSCEDAEVPVDRPKHWLLMTPDEAVDGIRSFAPLDEKMHALRGLGIKGCMGDPHGLAPTIRDLYLHFRAWYFRTGVIEAAKCLSYMGTRQSFEFLLELWERDCVPGVFDAFLAAGDGVGHDSLVLTTVIYDHDSLWAPDDRRWAWPIIYAFSNAHLRLAELGFVDGVEGVTAPSLVPYHSRRCPDDFEAVKRWSVEGGKRALEEFREIWRRHSRE